MPIKNYTTEISVEKTMGEVIGSLTRRGVTRISSMFDDNGKPAGISFVMKTDYGFREFELPVRTDGVLASLKRDKAAPRYQTPEHAARVAWRIAADWLAAQAALIDSDLAKLDEVMLPYMVAPNGQTMYELQRESALKGIES